MTIRRVWPLAALLCLAAATPCLAGRSLSVRLVHATNEGQGSAAGLEDVQHALKQSLPYTTFRLLSSASVPLPANNDAASLDSVTIRCSGSQESLTITVNQGGKQILNTTVNLRDGKPFILGGLPAKEGKKVLVFVAR